MTTFQLTDDGQGNKALTFFDGEGGVHSINSGTTGFQNALDAVLAGDTDAAVTAAVPLLTISARLAEVDPSYGTDGDVVTRNGVPLSDRLSKTLLGYARTGADGLRALGQFLVRLDNNPSARSVNSLYDFIDQNGLTIDPDGLIVAHKGIRTDGRSVHSGTAFVNGVKHVGNIPNAVGDVITMPRNQVQDDPSVACHQGLHVGAHAYASSFGQVLLTVKVDPADVVSVPTDCNAQKMRVCRYTVVSVNESKRDFAHYSVVDDVDEYEDDYCDCPDCEGNH